MNLALLPKCGLRPPRRLEGLNLRVDVGRKELVPAGPVPAAGAGVGGWSTLSGPALPPSPDYFTASLGNGVATSRDTSQRPFTFLNTIV